MATNPIEVKNRKAEYEYHLLDSYTCGMVLMGSKNQEHTGGRGQY